MFFIYYFSLHLSLLWRTDICDFCIGDMLLKGRTRVGRPPRFSMGWGGHQLMLRLQRTPISDLMACFRWGRDRNTAWLKGGVSKAGFFAQQTFYTHRPGYCHLWPKWTHGKMKEDHSWRSLGTSPLDAFIQYFYFPGSVIKNCLSFCPKELHTLLLASINYPFR